MALMVNDHKPTKTRVPEEIKVSRRTGSEQAGLKRHPTVREQGVVSDAAATVLCHRS